MERALFSLIPIALVRHMSTDILKCFKRQSRAGSWVAFICLCACAASGMVRAAEVADSAPAVGDRVYRVQPGDVLFVSVWKEQDLQLEVLVRPDGALSFPLAGELKAEGRSVEELRAELDQRLRRYIPEAVVTISVKELNGNRIYVLGKVNRPGEFPFGRPLDVMQALSLAGGATPFAALNDVRVLRRENGRQIAIEFHYGEVERGRNLEQNIELHSGDVVVVP
jgi:polysaccharide export outer membrane protein